MTTADPRWLALADKFHHRAVVDPLAEGKDILDGKHGNTQVSILRKIYGVGFAAGYPGTATLSEVLAQLNETSLSQLRRDHQTGHLEHKISHAGT